MAKITTTYAHLQAILDDIIFQGSQSASYEIFNHQKIKSFHHQNKIRIDILQKAKDRLVKQFVLHENDQPLKEEKDGQILWRFDSEEKQDQYLAELNAFRAKNIELFI